MEAIRQGDIPGVQLRQRIDLRMSREELWRWLVEDDLLLRWAAAEVERESGGRLRLRLSEDDGGGWESWQTVLRSAPQRWVIRLERLAAGWRVATPVTFDLLAIGGEAQLSVRQEGFHQLNLSTCMTVWEQYRRRWRLALDRLASAAE